MSDPWAHTVCAVTVEQGGIINGHAATYCTGAFVIATDREWLWRCVTVGRFGRNKYVVSVMVMARLATVTTLVCALTSTEGRRDVAGLQH